jgi:SAM-dependent methyltransferase/uncharacterized protein YbaR (Trm112 family)
VRRRHFEALHPVCPVCRAPNDVSFALRIAEVAREENGHIVEGALHCTNANCLREFPIVDGIPLIVANIRQYVSENALAIYGRRDLSSFVESMLGDCCGPGSVFDQTRQHLSSYAWDHYGDLDPQEAVEKLATPLGSSRRKEAHIVSGEGNQSLVTSAATGHGFPRPGSMLKNLETGLALAQPLSANGAVLDAGCSVGRGTFALAERCDGLVLGVDLNFPMLRQASEVLRHGKVRYPRRRTGLVYDGREFSTDFVRQENVDFWACDAAALPFPDETFSLAVNMNLLDCVYSPRDLLVSLGRVLQPGGKMVLACPYDWSAAATPVEGWLGGHSQRSPAAGSCEAVLRTLLTPKVHPGSLNTLKLIGESENLPWHVRLHERSTMTYKLHLVVAEKVGEA